MSGSTHDLILKDWSWSCMSLSLSLPVDEPRSGSMSRKIRLWLYFWLYSYCFHVSKEKAFRMRAKVTLSQVQRETLTLSWPMVQLHHSLSKSETFPCLSWPQPQMIWSLFQSIFALRFVRAWTETNCFKENLTPKKHRDRFCRLSPTFWLIFKSLFTAFTLGIIMNNGKRSSSPP